MTVKDIANVVDGLTVLYGQQMRSAPAGSLSEMKSTGAYNAMIALRAMIKDEDLNPANISTERWKNNTGSDADRIAQENLNAKKAIEELGKVRKVKGDNS